MEKKVQFISMPLLLLLEWTAAGPSIRGPIRISTSFFLLYTNNYRRETRTFDQTNDTARLKRGIPIIDTIEYANDESTRRFRNFVGFSRLVEHNGRSCFLLALFHTLSFCFFSRRDAATPHAATLAREEETRGSERARERVHLVGARLYTKLQRRQRRQKRQRLHLSCAWLLPVTCCNFTICRFHTFSPYDNFLSFSLQSL